MIILHNIIRIKFRRILLIVGAGLIYFLYEFMTLEDDANHVLENLDLGLELIDRYLINTSTCRIPDLGPINVGITNHVHREEFTPCTDKGLLTYIEKTKEGTYLKINSSILSLYSSSLTCCYSNITRPNNAHIDDAVMYSECYRFEVSVRLYHPLVKVICANSVKMAEYINVHFTTLPEQHYHIKERTSGPNTKFSVVFIGIDSISRWNLQRTMPKSYNFLERNYYSLNGYNKVGENTFPNLMALFTGEDMNTYKKTCDNNRSTMNECDFVWNYFHENGYITAYAEDYTILSTFNYISSGFKNPPTDYYYRPYSLAVESLPKTVKHIMIQCTGPEHYGVRMFNAARDFIVSFPDKPIFGLFWMNAFSHDDFNFPATMDDNILAFLTEPVLRSSLENTIVVFLSDHGIRYGEIRNSYRGWLEERLPYMFVHIPEAFKKSYPDRFQRFLINRNMLTTPFDFHATMQDVLKMGNEAYAMKDTAGCGMAKSLFSDIQENRTCETACIPDYYCVCKGYEYVDPDQSFVERIAAAVVTEINRIINSYEEGDQCSEYKLGTVQSIGVREAANNTHPMHATPRKQYLLKVDTEPFAKFEAVVEVDMVDNSYKYKITSDISRLNRYSCYSACVSNKILKKYCFCEGMLNKLYLKAGKVFGNC